MHKYLKSIGYGDKISEIELRKILKEIEKSYSHHDLLALDAETDYCEYRMECADNVGICVYGIMDMEENFERQSYYPYLDGSEITVHGDVTLEQRIDRDAYAGICEDSRVGISLIFHIINSMECITLGAKSGEKMRHVSVAFSGLCNEGTILLPVKKDPKLQEKSKAESQNRRNLLTKARTGDPMAIESLTLDDIDIYSRVSRRLVFEDVLSIVDTYFMPYGIECDRYSILGEILSIRKIENWETGEELYLMGLNVNELKFDICVPVKTVIGEPAVGRRFKGNIWLQGRILF